MKKVNSNTGTNEAYGINTARGTNAEMLALFPKAGLYFYNEDDNIYYYANGTIWLSTNALSIYKSGSVAGASFTGNPAIFVVVFNTPMPSVNYAISLVGSVGSFRAYTYSNKTINGFTINSNSGQPLTGDTDWIAILNNDL